MVSTFLGAMQVDLAVNQVSLVHWVSLLSAFRYFNVIVLIGTTIISLSLVVDFLRWVDIYN